MSLATETFEQELNQIQDKTIRDFTIHVLEKAPPYFWVVPSSSTGKYHSRQSNGEGGLVRHTKGVVYFAGIFCRAYNIEGKYKDRIIAACLFHDVCKYGITMQKYTTKTHDKEASVFVYKLGETFTGLDKTDLVEICNICLHHMGQWGVHERVKKFPEAYTTAELILHLSDMASAGKEVSLDFLNTFDLG